MITSYKLTKCLGKEKTCMHAVGLIILRGGYRLLHSFYSLLYIAIDL